MRLLMIATGYLPYLFSENLCNGKLVFALKESGIDVDVISRVDNGPTYQTEWQEPWIPLKDSSYVISYPAGSTIGRIYDTLRSGIVMDWNFINGIRWARRACEKATELLSTNQYDAILTRSPNDIAHLVGYMLKKKHPGIKWIANWNDPAGPIWPEPYKHVLSPKKQRPEEAFTTKLLRAADINTFPSDSLRNHFISFFPFLSVKATAVVPHIGMSRNVFNKKPSARHAKLMLCHSGNLSKERNPELTFRAMKELVAEGYTDFCLDIMGRENPEVSRLVKEYGLGEYVRHIGSFGYMEALDRLQDYDVLVLLEAILEKGIFFASKFTDYAQTGLPILAISPKQGFAHDMIEKYKAGIVADNTDYHSIKSSLKKLIEYFRNGTIFEYTSKSLFEEFSPENVVKIYKGLI